MAANILELLRQIQRDLANLHETNRNINEKIDKQQVIIDDIQQHVKKNNMVLFGNDDTQIKLEDTTADSHKTGFEENKVNDGHPVENTENIEANQIQTAVKESVSSCDVDHKKTNSFQKADDVSKTTEEFITKKTKESIKDFIASTKRSVKEAAKQKTNQIHNLSDELKRISDIYQSGTKEMKESFDFFAVTIKAITETVTNLICKLNDELKNMSSMYHSDMKETKQSINDLVATVKISTQETASMVNEHCKNTVPTFPDNLSTEQIIKLCAELKQINYTYQSEIQATKKLMDDTVESINKINKVAASQARKQVAVQITPTYLNTFQISTLNEELKRITEMYASTDVFPVIEAQSGPCDHPVMKQLSKGVIYRNKNKNKGDMGFKLGPNNINRSEVLALVTEYPDLSLFEVSKALSISRNKWDEWTREFNFGTAFYGTARGLRPLNL